MRTFMLGLGIAAFLVAAMLAVRDNTTGRTASAPALPASSPTSLSTPVPIRVTTATLAQPGSISADTGLRSLSLPTTSPPEQGAASRTRLYLTAFQNQNVSVIDPLSGHALHEIPVEGDQAGLAVSPDGTRLNVVDGQASGYLRVFDTHTWHVIHSELVPERLMLLTGNPISLSGDGHWLVVPHYSYTNSRYWNAVFDTRQMRFLQGDPLQPVGCSEAWAPPRLLGRVGHPRLYTICDGNVMALDAKTFAKLWQVPAPSTHPSDMVLSPDGLDLYAVYPLGETGCFESLANDLGLYAWETSTGHLVKQMHLSDLVPVPMGTCGNGGRVYMTISPDGTDLFLSWEDRLWKISNWGGSLNLAGELKLPSVMDGGALSPDGRELYLLPTTMGDLTVRERGMWTVDTTGLTIVRHASDWPRLTAPFMFAAPAPN